MPPFSHEDRIRQIRAEAAAEAAERMDRLTTAFKFANVGEPLAVEPKRKLTVLEEEAERVARNMARKQQMLDNAVSRDPCFACGVPADRHAEHGCRRWRGMR